MTQGGIALTINAFRSLGVVASELPLGVDVNARLLLLGKGLEIMQDTTITPDQSDQMLVELARQGDKDAFGELIRRYRQKCVDLATCFLHNRGDAEDEVQNAFAKAYAHLDQYEGRAEFVTWLSRIVTNQCLMLLRERRRVQFVYLDDSGNGQEGPPRELPAKDWDPEGELAFRQIKQVVTAEVQRLPPLLRNVMLLRDLQNLPMSAVAERLGITVPAAKSRLLRARTEVQQCMMSQHEKFGKLFSLSRSAAPLNRMAHHRAMRPAITVGA